MNVIELLKEDHNRVDLLFQKVKATDESEHQELFEQIKEELEIHAHIEEVIFYPKLKEEGDKELQDITLEGIEEHHQAKIFLRELSNLADESEKFEPKLKVLMEDIEHHVQEEEGQMFPMVEEQFDEATLEDLGKQIEEEKGRYKKTMAAGSK
jgi:iron-sulfur cluster repair protein YtfE (RIC family)